MDPTVAGKEASARGLLERAVKMDEACRFTEAQVCYEEGLQLLIEVSKSFKDKTKRDHYRKKISGYMDRAEKLKEHIKREKEEQEHTEPGGCCLIDARPLYGIGKYNEQINVEDNSTGYSYEKVFGRFIDETLTEVEVQDPYIRSIHQVFNFLRLCELLVKSKRANVRKIKLITGRDDGGSQRQQQEQRLAEIRDSLMGHNVTLDVTFSDTLHDREIRFNNGWIIKIGRGLDYFKATPTKFCLGYCDYDLRPCHQTTIDILHRKNTKPANLAGSR